MITAAKLFTEQNPTTAGGRRVQLIIRDDGGVPNFVARQTVRRSTARAGRSYFAES